MISAESGTSVRLSAPLPRLSWIEKFQAEFQQKKKIKALIELIAIPAQGTALPCLTVVACPGILLGSPQLPSSHLHRRLKAEAEGFIQTSHRRDPFERQQFVGGCSERLR